MKTLTSGNFIYSSLWSGKGVGGWAASTDAEGREGSGSLRSEQSYGNAEALKVSKRWSWFQVKGPGDSRH